MLQLIKRTSFFEKAEKVKNQFYEKFDTILGKLGVHDAVLSSLSANDTSILQGLVFLVERAREEQQARQEVLRRLGQVERTMGEGSEEVRETQAGAERRLAALERVVHGLEQTFPTEVRSALAGAERAIAELGNTLEPRLASTERGLEALARADEERRSRSRRNGIASGTLLVDTPHYEHFTPEVGLMAHLASYLPSRAALDIGANVGEVSEALLDAGLEVHAFEPFPPTLEKLRERLHGRAGFHAHGEAVGSRDGVMDLHLATDISPEGVYKDSSLYSSLVRHAMPADLPFTRSVQVPVRSVESLHASGEIPAAIGLVKIDTEGFDLEVIRGMGAHRYAVVSAEFWDEKIAFGKAGALNRLDMLVREMRGRGYPWHLVVYRVWGSDEVAFYCNLAHSVEGSWGNVFFFQDHPLFAHARDWSSAVLPAAYFREVVPRATATGHPSLSPEAVAVR